MFGRGDQVGGLGQKRGAGCEEVLVPGQRGQTPDPGFGAGMRLRRPPLQASRASRTRGRGHNKGWTTLYLLEFCLGPSCWVDTIVNFEFLP